IGVEHRLRGIGRRQRCCRAAGTPGQRIGGSAQSRCLPQPLGALPLVSDVITLCVETRQPQGGSCVFVHEAPQRTPSRLRRVTRQLDDFWCAEPSQLLHRPGSRIEPADIAARQNLPRSVAARVKVETSSWQNAGIKEMGGKKGENQPLVDYVRFGWILGGARALAQFSNLLVCHILVLPPSRGNTRRRPQP